MAVVYNTSAVTAGLVLGLDFQNIKSYPGSGATITDISPNRYVATLYNGPSFSSGAFSFDGSNDYIGVPSPAGRWNWAPAGTTFSNELSIEIWVKSSDTSGYYVSKPWNGNGEYNYAVQHTSWFTGVAGQIHTQTFPTLSTNRWEHAVFIVNSTQKAVYRNGVISAAFTNHGITSVTPTTPSNNEDLSLMTLYPYGTGTWDQPTHAINGQMAMCRVYNKVLTAQEVVQNFNAYRGRFGV